MGMTFAFSWSVFAITALQDGGATGTFLYKEGTATSLQDYFSH